MPAKSPLNPVIHGAIARDGYTVEKVFFASLPGHYVTGNLYRPTGTTEKHPAVLAPYGHWPQGRLMWNSDEKVAKEIASGAETFPEAARSPLQAGCAMLARMGCTVFQYDLVGYCDSNQFVHREGFQDAEAVLRLQSFMGLQTWNSIRALDFVTSLPEVDADRIAVTGASGGGTQTFMLAAVDWRVAADFPIVMVSMNMQGGCVCENAPLLRVGTNNVEIASLFAPKPQGLAAADDWTHDFMTRGLPEMKSIYALYNAVDQVEGRHFKFPHNYNQHSREMMYSFLNLHLRLGLATPIVEKPFTPIAPAELAVYDAAHPVPADAVDAAAIRERMTTESDQQLAELAKDPARYAEIVRGALEAMVTDAMPAANEIEVIDVKGAPPFEAGGEWTGFVARKASGDRVACRAIFPRAWRGKILVWAHPDGRDSVADADGRLRSEVKNAIDSGSAVVSMDWSAQNSASVASSQSASTPATIATSRATPYAGLTLGYNRSAIAQQVHDLLSTIALARKWSGTQRVDLIAVKDRGPAALIARILATDVVDRAFIDLGQFDFDRVTDQADPMLLPGGLKYGGVYGLARACTTGQTRLSDARRCGQFDAASKLANVTLMESSVEVGAMVDWLRK